MSSIFVSTDRSKLDISFIHHYLSEESYWSKGIPRTVLERAIEHSLCFGLYDGSQQIGFARVISDRATFAYLADVFISQAYRGKKLSIFLLKNIMKHPDLQGLRRWMLGTKDAHGLYRKFGWKELADPGRFMELHDPKVYG